MARRRFFVDQIAEGHGEITGENAHHLTRVLRVQAGQTFEITDNRQAWVATVESLGKNWVRFALLEPLDAGTAMAATTLYLALIKFDRFEWAVEKATELGVTRIVPVETSRSDQGLFEGSKKRVDRWRKIAREASEQSRRLQTALVDEPVKLGKALEDSTGERVWLDERPGAVPLASALTSAGDVSLFVGPEGGWTEKEAAALDHAGWRGASLGPLVLRAETAVCAALAVTCSWRLLAGTWRESARPQEPS